MLGLELLFQAEVAWHKGDEAYPLIGRSAIFPWFFAFISAELFMQIIFSRIPGSRVSASFSIKS